MLKQEEAISSATSITLSLDLRNSNDRINKNTKSSKGNKKAVKIPNIFSQYIGQLIGGRLVTKGTPLSISIFGVSHRFLIVDIKNKPTVTLLVISSTLCITFTFTFNYNTNNIILQYFNCYNIQYCY